jgi:hypothetical protein
VCFGFGGVWLKNWYLFVCLVENPGFWFPHSQTLISSIDYPPRRYAQQQQQQL